MKKSRFFFDLGRSYSDEIDDLFSDSEGNSVLQKRLNEKRREIGAILPMIEFSPEMVAVVFYGAFGFKSPAVMQRIVSSQPGHSGFIAWSTLKRELSIADWAQTLIASTLKAPGGDAFLVATAALEFLRTADKSDLAAPEQSADKAPGDARADGDEDREDHDSDGDTADLSEAGAAWLSEQGFETLDR